MAHNESAAGDGGPASPRSTDAVVRPAAAGAWAASRQRRRVSAALSAALVLAAFAGLLGVAVDRASSPGAGQRRPTASTWGGGRGLGSGGGGALSLLQQRLDAFDDDDDGDDDDDDDSVNVRDDMLASAPSRRTQSLSWLDWTEDDIEREERGIKQRLITIEQGLVAQPQRLNEMKVALGKVYEYYGPTGKLREGVPEALKSVQVQMQAAEDEIMQSERMRKLTADISAIREGARLFLAAQKTKDYTQDSLLGWTTKAQSALIKSSDEHFKTLQEHVRDDASDVSGLVTDVKEWRREMRRTIDRAVRRKKEELEAKGKELMIKFFGGGDRRKGQATGLWDAIEDEANANVTKGIAASFAKWDAAMREMDGSLQNMSSGLNWLPAVIEAWDMNVTWRLGNLSHSIARFKQMQENVTTPLSTQGKQQWKNVEALQNAIDDMAEQRAVSMDPCIGARETVEALTVLIEMLTARAHDLLVDDLEGQEKLDAVRSAFYALESKLLNEEEKKKLFGVLLGDASDKNDTATEAEQSAQDLYSQTMARIILEQKGVLDERALILTILKLLSQQDYSKAEEKMQDLARLSPMAGILTLLSQRSYRNPFQAHRGRQATAALLEWRAPAAADGDGDGKGGTQEAVDPDIYTQEGGRYKYGIQVRDSEEIRVVKGIMLKILLQLDEQEANLQKQQDLWNEILRAKHDARIKWGKTLLQHMEEVSNLSKSITSHKIQSDLNEAQLQYRKEAFNATHSVFAIESKMLAEEIATLRKALARTQTKVEACDLERELNGGKETPKAAEASAKAAEAWKVLMGRLIKHNSTSKFLNALAPEVLGTGATAPAARGERVRLASAQAVAHEVAVKNQVLDSLNDALRKLNAAQEAERKLHKTVAVGRIRLRELNLQLAQASMLSQLAKGKDVKGRMPFDLSDLPQHRGREKFAEEKHEVHQFVKALRVPATKYRQQIDHLDSKIAHLKRIAAQKKAASSINLPRRSAGRWGQAYFVGAQTQRPHWY